MSAANASAATTDGPTQQPATAGLSRRRVLEGAVGLGLTAVARTAVVGATGAGVLLVPAAAEAKATKPSKQPKPPKAEKRDTDPSEALTGWLRVLYGALMDEPWVTPGRAARAYATAMVAAHETVADPKGKKGPAPLAGRLGGLGPAPTCTGGPVDGPAAVSAAIHAVTAAVLQRAAASTRGRFDDRHAATVTERLAAGVSRKAVERGVEHGTAVGRHIAAWAATDGAEEANARSYSPPVGPDLWRSTPPNFGTAIDPWWGTVRTMALPSADACQPVDPIAFSTASGSAFHAQAQAVLDTADSLTDEGRAISIFWRDNPTTSGLPSGHWLLLVAQLVDEQGLGLHRAAAVLATTGVTLHDAFVSCWHEKYRTNLLRPISYINAHVPGREDWRSHVNTPQFPEYTSGHSVASQAAATVLTALLGTVPFTDRTHALRNPTLGSRSFASFQDAAYEAANSRLLGGIHYPMGIDVGLQQGEQVGRLVLERLGIA